jgi:ADP-ribose pyrophosphatase YjhB (NUDIX family)
MEHYSQQAKMLVAVDCIIFGFDDRELKILLIRRELEPEAGKWSLMGGFVQNNENLAKAAARILKKLTGLENVYLEELHSFSEPGRDPGERTISIACFALIDIHKYEKQLSGEYHAEWFPLKKIPKLIFDHTKMVTAAKKRLRYKAAFHPVLFELMPARFSIPQLQNLYEQVYDIVLDKGNFSRKILSTKLLIKLAEKDKSNSRKGAFYYKLDRKHYNANFHAVLNFIPNPDSILKQ